MAVGAGAKDDDGDRIAMDVKAGDKILFGKWSGTEVTIDGKEMLIMKESDILGHRRLIVFDPSTAIPEFTGAYHGC